MKKECPWVTPIMKKEYPWVNFLSGKETEDIKLGEIYRFYVHPSFPDRDYIKNNFKVVKAISLYGYGVVRIKVRSMSNSDNTFNCYASNLFDIGS